MRDTELDPASKPFLLPSPPLPSPPRPAPVFPTERLTLFLWTSKLEHRSWLYDGAYRGIVKLADCNGQRREIRRNEIASVLKSEKSAIKYPRTRLERLHLWFLPRFPIESSPEILGGKRHTSRHPLSVTFVTLVAGSLRLANFSRDS